MDLVQVVHSGGRPTSGRRILASASLVEHAELGGPHRRLHAVASPKLFADAPNVPLDGARADGQDPGYLLIGLPLHDQPQDLDLSGREGVGEA